MASSSSISLKHELNGDDVHGDSSTTPISSSSSSGEDITLLWGVNVIASVVGTVLTATSSMIIGFSGNLLIGAGLYLSAPGAASCGTKNIAKSRS